jgi:hypothetical protein
MGINLTLMGYHGKTWEIKQNKRFRGRKLWISLGISQLTKIRITLIIFPISVISLTAS